MKYKKVRNRESDDSTFYDNDVNDIIEDIDLDNNGAFSDRQGELYNDNSLENESLKAKDNDKQQNIIDNINELDEGDSSESESSYEEEDTQTSALFDSIMSDNRVIASLGGAILLFIGSYLSFWGVISDAGKISQGNLFTGYMFGGVFGKLCVIMAAVSAVLVCIRVYKVAWYFNIGSFLAYIVQVLLIVIAGKNVLGNGVKVTLYPAFGSIICLIALIIMTVFIKKLSKFNKK